MESKVRWKQRFNSFEKAINLLQEIQFLDLSTLNLLEKEGIIQRFEYTLELAWKTLKDKMEFDGLTLDKISPKMILKDGYKNKYIDNIESWIEMINDRNLLSHSYDFEIFVKIIPEIKKTYLPLLLNLYYSLKEN